jgi:type II secretory pathway pseudopilin PulG
MTLVDLLLAMGILAVGLSMIATVFPVAAEHTREALDQSMAVVVARNAEATLRAMATSADYPPQRFTGIAQVNAVLSPYRVMGASMPDDSSVVPESTYFVALPEINPTDIGWRIKNLGLNVFSFRPYASGSSGAMDVGGQYYWRAVYSRCETPIYDSNPGDGSARINLIILVCKLPDGEVFAPNSRVSLSHFSDPVQAWSYSGQAVAVRDGTYMLTAGGVRIGGKTWGGVGTDSTWFMWYDPNVIYIYRTAIEVVQ